MTPDQLAEYERAWCDGDPETDEARAIRELIREVQSVARERDDLGRLTDRLRDRLMTLDRERNRALAQLSAYADLPPEPDTAMGAFMAVLAVDNDPEEPDNYAGDCDAEATNWPDDARWRPLQRLTAWTSLPEIPEHYEAVEVKLNDDARIFAWRDDDGGWHTEGRVGITDADVVGWRSIIP